MVSPVDAAINSVNRAIASFHPGAIPPLARVHYRRELVAWMLLPLMLGAIEGGVVSVLAKNAFEGAVAPRALNLAVAVLSGAPAFANIASFLWAALSHGRHKIRFLVGLQVATAVLVALVALAPLNGAGLVMLTAGVVGARLCWSGVVTVRSTVWRANYRRSERATVAGKLATVQALTMTAVGLVIGAAMNYNEDAFRLLYPLAALGGLLGAFAYRRLRVRGHRALVRAEQAAVNPLGSWRPVLGDRRFRRFMGCQFVFGIGNMMITAPLIIMLREEFAMGYLGGMLICSVIPLLLMAVTIPAWSRLMDRVHIVHFRAIHSWVAVAVAATMLLGALLREPSLIWVAAALRGVSFGGGMLAWNLGHHDFAPLADASRYMGVHVTLTGARGLLAPLLAVGLYDLLNGLSDGAGAWVFGVCVALTATGALGFGFMHRAMTARAVAAADGAGDRARTAALGPDPTGPTARHTPRKPV